MGRGEDSPKTPVSDPPFPFGTVRISLLTFKGVKILFMVYTIVCTISK